MKALPRDYRVFNRFFSRPDVREILKILYDNRCQGCEQLIDGHVRRGVAAHIIPQSYPREFEARFPGLDVDNLLNLHLLCDLCNSRASNAYIAGEFRLNQLHNWSAMTIAYRISKAFDRRTGTADWEKPLQRVCEAMGTTYTLNPALLALKPSAVTGVLWTSFEDLTAWLTSATALEGDNVEEAFTAFSYSMRNAHVFYGHPTFRAPWVEHPRWLKELSEPPPGTASNPAGLYVNQAFARSRDLEIRISRRSERVLRNITREIFAAYREAQRGAGSDSYVWICDRDAPSPLEYLRWAGADIPIVQEIHPADLNEHEGSQLQDDCKLLDRLQLPGRRRLYCRLELAGALERCAEVAIHLHTVLLDGVRTVSNERQDTLAPFPRFCGALADAPRQYTGQWLDPDSPLLEERADLKAPPPPLPGHSRRDLGVTSIYGHW